jgi:hypothetical protein
MPDERYYPRQPRINAKPHGIYGLFLTCIVKLRD